MTIYGTRLPGAAWIARLADKIDALTPRARWRLRVLDWHRAHGGNLSLTARHFGLTRATVRTWLKRLRAEGPVGLNDRSHRPRRLRQPTTPWTAVIKVVQLRKAYPAWSKYKLQVLLARQGLAVSASTVGRILRRRGLIEPRVARRRRRAALRPKARFPRGLAIRAPGDLIQMDTKHLRPSASRPLYQFTAIDVLSKMRVVRVYASESSRTGATFLADCLQSFPFPIRAVQTDNGAPFLREFERLCQARSLPHYFIYPRSPKQNAYVEIAHGADEREFYQQGNLEGERGAMQARLAEWEAIWNEVRPHEALNYLTPSAYVEKWRHGGLPTQDVITLQT